MNAVVLVVVAAALAGCASSAGVPEPPTAPPENFEVWLINDGGQSIEATVRMWLDGERYHICTERIREDERAKCNTDTTVNGNRPVFEVSSTLADGRSKWNMQAVECYQAQVFLSEFGVEIKQFCG